MYIYYIIECRCLPKQGSVTSLSSTLPVPALHMQTVASPPAEALFAGQGAHIGSPGGVAGSMYWFTGQATWRRERSVSIYTHYNVLEVKCTGSHNTVCWLCTIYIRAIVLLLVFFDGTPQLKLCNTAIIIITYRYIDIQCAVISSVIIYRNHSKVFANSGRICITIGPGTFTILS